MKKGYIYSILSAILFGSAGIIIKSAFDEGVDSVDLLTLQYIIAVSLMFFVIFIFNKELFKIKKRELFHTGILGIVGNTFMTVFYYMAFNYLDVAMVTILLYTYPIMVFIYSLLTKKENIDFSKLLALIMAFIGCILSLNIINKSFSLSFIGILCGILSAVFYSFMNIYSEKRLSSVNSITINFYSTIFSLLSLVVYRFPFYILNGQVNLNLITYTTLLAVFCEIIPLTLLYSAIKQIGSLKVSIIGNLEIPTAMLLSFFILNERASIVQLLGACLVIYAVNIIRNK